MNADLLISMVLNEGHKRPILAIVGGRRDPRFGRKARRFSSTVPLIDKGGDLSIVDRFGNERPNSRVKLGLDNPLGHFGPPANNKNRRDRHEALIHLYHHIADHKTRGTLPKESARLEHLIYHRDRLLKAEARSMHKMARRAFRRSTGFPITNSSSYDASKEANSDHIKKTAGKGIDLHPAVWRALNNVDTRLHDVQDHAFLGALPTEKGEVMVDILDALRGRYGGGGVDPGDYSNSLGSVYSDALRHGALKNDIHEHDPDKVLDMARKVKG
jgi:hypothetical protein